MNYRPIFTLVLLVLIGALLAAGCDSTPTGTTPPDITGTIEMPAPLASPEGTTVYLLPLISWFAPYVTVIDSTLADFRGRFAFGGLNGGSYTLYAARPSYVSPCSAPVTVDGKIAGDLCLRLQAIDVAGEVGGTAMQGITGEPAGQASVKLHRLAGARFVATDSTLAAADGAYAFTTVATGNYCVSATLATGETGPAFVSAESDVFFCDGLSAAGLDTLWLQDINVDKPAIYIYPETAGRFQVCLALHQGTRLTRSIPDYGQGWVVQVEPTGRINDRYDYLFYEASLSRLPALSRGWCLAAADLEPGLDALLTRYGLTAAERRDFLVYWLERLGQRPFYRVHPLVGADLDPWVELAITPTPASLLRLWFVFQGCDTRETLPEPPVNTFVRNGATVVEWGGTLLP